MACPAKAKTTSDCAFKHDKAAGFAPGGFLLRADGRVKNAKKFAKRACAMAGPELEVAASVPPGDYIGMDMGL